METKFYPNSATLFPVKEKRSEKGPDLSGRVELGPDLVDYIIRQSKAGNSEIVLDISGWKKVSRAGSKFISCQVKEPYKPKDGAAPKKKTSFDDDDDGAPF